MKVWRGNAYNERGEEQLSGDVRSSYLGFLLQDGTYLDIANMATGTYYGFKRG